MHTHFLAVAVVLMSTGRLLAQADERDSKRRHTNAKEMLAICDDFVSKHPNSASGYLGRAVVWAELGSGYKSVSDYTTAIRLLEPNEPTSSTMDLMGAFRERGTVWYTLGEPDLARSDHDEAVRLCTEAIKANRKDIPAVYGYIYRANVWGESHEPRRAIEDCNAAIQIDPQKALAYQCRGNAYEELDESDRAMQDFDAAIKLDSQSVKTYMFRGSLHIQRKSFDKALDDLSAAIALRKTSPKLFLIRSSVFKAKGELAAALKDADEAVRLGPDDYICLMARAELRRSMDDVAGADEDRKHVLECVPKNPKGLNVFARWMATSEVAAFRDGRAAVELAEKACEATNWKNIQYLDTLAAAYAETGQFEKAVEWQKKAHDLASEAQKKMFASRMTLYRSGKLYREAPMLE